MKKKIMNALEVFAKAMVQPLMYLTVSGLVMVVGVLITNSTISQMVPFLSWGPIQLIGKLIYNCVMVIINNLSVIFAVGIPAALAKKDKHQAGLIGLMSYLMFLCASNTTLVHFNNLADASGFLGLIGTGQANILGIQATDMSVFGGIVIGLLTGYVYNRTCNKKFSGFLQIYSGTRFSFFIMMIVAISSGVVASFAWPAVQGVIASLANVIKSTGVFGLFLYGFLERLLIPTGLHHLVYTPFQFSDLGGVLNIGGQNVAGAYAIVMAEMGMPDLARFSDSIYYMAIGFTKCFGYIGIGAAFIHTAYKQNKSKVKATIIPLVVMSVLASITEPIDFMFVFVAPLLFVVHAGIAGLFIALLKICDVTAFCGGNLIASTLMNLVAGVSKTHWPVMYLLGILQIIVYFVVFSYLIKKFNFKTPGREDEENKDVEPAKALDLKSDIVYIIQGLGGKENINTVENCFTRLRVNVINPDLVDDATINKTVNSGIVRKDCDIQIIYGLQVAEVRKAVEDHLEAM